MTGLVLYTRKSVLPSLFSPIFLLVTLYLLLSLLIASVVVVDASDFNAPHGHQGKVTPFEPGDPKVPLDGKAIKILKSGKPYQTQIQSGSSGRGLVVQDIHAPSSIVWDRILDYNNYAKMVPKTIDSKNYNIIQHKPTKKDPLAQTIYTRMKVGFPMIKLEFFVKHLYYPSLNSLTWTLDYTKKSDFDDSCGYWYVIPHPDSPREYTRVYYSVQVSMFDWVPKFVVDFMSTKALTDATAWVKKFSELEYSKELEKRGGVGAAGEEEEGEEKGAKKREKPSNPIVDFFNVGKRRREAKARREAEEREASQTREIEQDAIKKSQNKVDFSSVGVTRVVVVSVVVTLAIYNVHLWLSH